MSSNIAIKVEKLSKCYHMYNKPGDRLKQFVLPKLQCFTNRPQKIFYRKFWALKDVSFELKKGEVTGIIGRNGSGKSTLLQLICGTLSATYGSLETNGRIAALLELGSGFNPEFTGRENVYMNASLLGLGKDEIDARFNDIVDFADIGDFIEQPVKSFSSGMMVRLAFAVQAQIVPDIFIIDEALAVGDAKFQAKCFDRLRQLKDSGTSILLVTHSSEQIVTHCSQAILLDKGVVVEAGNPRHVVNTYFDILFGKERKECPQEPPAHQLEFQPQTTGNLSYGLSATCDVFSTHLGYNPYEYRWGDGSARILDFYLSADNKPYPSALRSGQQITLAIAIKFLKDLLCPIIGVTIKTKEGVTVYGVNSKTLDVAEFKHLGTQGQVIGVVLNFECRLAPGDYLVSIGVATMDGEQVIPHDRRYDSLHLQVSHETSFFGLIDLRGKMEVNNFIFS